jgi:hypothetical protein
MEIHVYRYMEKKYGLRSLAVEHAAMFLAGLKQHSPDNIDILVFFKIFCNEIEEGFVKVSISHFVLLLNVGIYGVMTIMYANIFE